ncbi:Hypothetical predicted protein [Olea europaea subsp. europaea]|uniref:Pentatricopeptide repeat-containing protein n=1 Tax=Olea europaea subsp. europaea TaxID=158383 RepID=A0A8S0VBY9_OLEEU|nr:Hypothetical predicted protein [Olea europaea subsp. europaea]
MWNFGGIPSTYTFVAALQACEDPILGSSGMEIHADVLKSGVELDYIAMLSVLSATADLSALRKGKEIHGYLLRNKWDERKEALRPLSEMWNFGGIPSTYTFVAALQACEEPILGSSGMEIHADVLKSESILFFEGSFAGSLMDIYASCGTVDNSYKAENLLPDDVAFLALLHECSHSSLVDEGERFFERMQHVYKLKPWPEHYTCLVDLLGRANYVEEAFQIVKSMKSEPTAAV